MKRNVILFVICLFTAFLIGCVKHTETPTQTIDATETFIVAAAQTQETADTPIPTYTPTPVPPTVVPTPEATQPPYVAADGIYTIAWMSDPQHYSNKFPETYYAMTEFLRDHREELRLAYVIQTGDLVNNADEEEQWTVADRAQSYIDEIPNGVLAGNHDVPKKIGYTAFCKVFGSARYEDKPWYGGSYQDNRGHFDLLTIGQTEFIFVYMGYGPTKQAYQWVRDTFKSYPDRIGVLCLHDYYTNDQTLSEDGQKWYDLVVKKTSNLYMVLCGHRYGAYCFPETFDDDKDGTPDRTVYQMLFNYQRTLHDGGAGYLRLIQLNDQSGTMHVLTYSPLWDDFNRFDDPAMREEYYEFDESHEDFILPMPWRITY